MAMVLAVLRSRVFRMRRRSRICQWQDLQTDEIWSLKVRLVSNRMPRLRVVDTGLMIVFWSILRDGSFSFDSWLLFPKTRNSVLEGFRDKRLADIHTETSDMQDCSLFIAVEKLSGEKQMNNCVSSA